MLAAPPIVTQARRTRQTSLMLVLGAALAVGWGTAALLWLLAPLPLAGQLAVLVAWCLGACAAVGYGTSRLSARNRWTVAVLRSHREARSAEQLEDRIDRFGELDPMTHPTVRTICRVAVRIDRLANGRTWLLEMTRTARETASRLDQEHRALGRMRPSGTALVALRGRLAADLEAHCERLVGVLDRLVAECAAEGLDAVDDAMSRLEAACEVHQSVRVASTVHPIRAVR